MSVGLLGAIAVVWFGGRRAVVAARASVRQGTRVTPSEPTSRRARPPGEPDGPVRASHGTKTMEVTTMSTMRTTADHIVPRTSFEADRAAPAFTGGSAP